MRFYSAGESLCRELLELPQEKVEWIITGAAADDIIAAGFQRQQAEETRFIHRESGDHYQLARRQYIDKESGQLRYRCGVDVTLEDELATRALTVLAMARDGTDIVDPFGGREDLADGVLRHVTPHFSRVPANMLIVAVWAARLSGWDFSIAHGTHALLKKMVASGAVEQMTQDQVSDAVLHAIASPWPASFFRVLHRCGALGKICKELGSLFDKCTQGDKQHTSGSNLPRALQQLDRAAKESGNIVSILKRFHQALGEDADKVFIALGLNALYLDVHSTTNEDFKQ
jgi:tRNA nucleotidyltransferase (CCA-adding enzyme)